MLRQKNSFSIESFTETFSTLLKSGKPQSRGKSLSEALMLTSLIDAFSILVVYLLMSFASSGEMAYMSSDLELPKASTLERLDRHSIIRITEKSYFIENNPVDLKGILPLLVSLKKQLSKRYGDTSEMAETITVQADKKTLYSRLSPVIQACAQAGFGDVKFAVLGK